MKIGQLKLDFKNKENIAKALLCKNKAQQDLFEYARYVRDKIFLKKVEVRSVIEYSNICQRSCNYCGMNRDSLVKRYILSERDFLKRIEMLYSNGRRVIMVQTGEFNSGKYFDTLYKLLKHVKDSYADLTLICSLGKLSEYKYKKLRDIGIERYLLKFETSDKKLYAKIKPSDNLLNRLKHIKILKKLGFQVSSGNITGLPGQSIESLINDLLLLKSLDLPMVSTSVFVPNNMSNYRDYPPGNINLVLNFTALLRIICPEALIPATSSLELVSKDAQYLGLMAGANVVTLHDGTPKKYEDKYIIYKKERYTPTDILFKIVKRSGLELSPVALLK